jgi:transposase
MKKGSSKSKQNPEPQTPRRRKYDEEFKRQAVAMVRNGQPVRSVAQALGISENVLHRWKREAIDSQSNSELEVEKLRQRLKQVEMERDILKKALSIVCPVKAGVFSGRRNNPTRGKVRTR